jgi:RsiW-degrading membrane proteinase PrsW (M82 family)
MPFLVSLVFSFVPMFLFALFIYWLDRYEKEPKLLLGGVFIWGAVFAASSAFIINTVIGAGIYLVTESEGAANITTGSLIAPVVEETLKGMAVLLVFITFRSEFDSVMDGIVYAAVTALGFAATENLHYIYNLGYLENGWNGLISMILIRDIVVSWQHPFYTAFIGIGLAAARLNQNLTVKITAPLLGLGTAIFFHSLHNTLAGLGDAMCIFGSILDWSGWLLMFIFILAMVNNEKKLLIQFLKSEVETGLIATGQIFPHSCGATPADHPVFTIFAVSWRIKSASLKNSVKRVATRLLFLPSEKN